MIRIFRKFLKIRPLRLAGKSRRGSSYSHEIDPDEIFLDSQNISRFNVHQLEGRLEKPISKSIVVLLSILFLIIGSFLIWRLNALQVSAGEEYFALSENNRLSKEPIFAERGIIYDRNGVELAWNKGTAPLPLSEREYPDYYRGEGEDEGGGERGSGGEEQSSYSAPLHRSYSTLGGLSHIIGYLSYPARDSAGFYWQEEFEGKDGVERQYNKLLNGKNGWKIVETNSIGEIQSENVIEWSEAGANIVLSIDSQVQSKLFSLIAKAAVQARFDGGVGIIMDIHTGEILSLTNFPEYNSEILSSGANRKVIEAYIVDDNKPFLNRSLSGLYAPGSIIKPFIALGALNEKVITPQKKILSTGSISIPNPYDPSKESIFKDWKAHGWVDMRAAIAVSSNVYFYSIGGGFENQKGIGIAGIEKYMRLFGFGEHTGIELNHIGEKQGLIPTPEWKERTFAGDPWRIGDTYNTVIGQYGFQITPIQITRAMAAIANYGTLVTPRFLFTKIEDPSPLPPGERKSQITNYQLPITNHHFTVVQEGLRQAVQSGTAIKLKYVPVKVAAKTGTAQVGPQKRYENSWVTGFFPYKNPRFAFTILMERGPKKSYLSAADVARDLLLWMGENTPEYLSSPSPSP